jgi:hypothetical protein
MPAVSGSLAQKLCSVYAQALALRFRRRLWHVSVEADGDPIRTKVNLFLDVFQLLDREGRR